MVLLFVILLAFATKLTWCREDGAPPLACNSMEPWHLNPSTNTYVEGQRKPSPYEIHAEWDKEQKYIRVSVTGDTLSGFIIQGATSDDGRAMGRFTKLSQDSRYQNCSGDKYDPGASLTHTHYQDKENLVFYWQPPSDEEGKVIFRATLAKTKNVYWLRQLSNSVSFDTRSNRTTLDERNGRSRASVSHPTITLLIVGVLTLLR